MTLTPLDTGLLLAVVRGTALLAGALLLAHATRHGSGAAKHALWTIAVGALLALPLLAGVMPHAGLPTLPFTGSAAAFAPQIGSSVEVRSGLPSASGVTAVSLDAPSVGVTVGPSPRAEALPALLLVWLVGFVVASAALAAGMVRANRLAGRAFPVADPAWRASLRSAMARLGVTRPVALRCSTEITVPMTGGIRHPVILLPVAAAGWTRECLDVVLLHEMVHVRRADVLRQVLSRLAVACYWFHPLAWRAARLAILAREQACDEAVIASGTRPSRYARHLIALADATTTSFRVPALVGLDHAQLEDRVMSILKHSPVGRRRTPAVMVGAGVMAWALCVASLGPRVVEAQGVEPPLPPAVEAPEPAPVVAEIPTPPVRPAAPAVVAGVTQRPTPPAPPVAPPIVAGVMARVAPPAVVAPRVARGAARQCGGLIPAASGPVRQIQQAMEGFLVCAQVSGRVDALSEETLIPAGRLPAGMTVTLGVSGPGVQQKMVITRGANGNDHAWYVGGEQRPFDREAAAWRDAVLEVLRGSVTSARRHAEMAEAEGELAGIRGEQMAAQAEAEMVQAEAAHRVSEAANQRHLVEVREQSRVIEREAQRLTEELGRVERRIASESDADRRRDLHEVMETTRRHLVEVEAQHAQVARHAEERAREIEEVEAQALMETRARSAHGAAVEARATAARRVAVEERLASLDARRRPTEGAAVDSGARARLLELVKRLGR